MAAACPTCEHADAHGSWPTDHAGTHCRGCHRSWSSTAQAHCTVCHAHFATNGVADQHWKHGRHLDPGSVAGLFLCLVDGIWSTSPDRDPDALRERLAASRQNGRITPPSRAESLSSTEDGEWAHELEVVR